jgi:TetR/AcrR family transcriptional repressor of multidrug resistance operon
MRVRDDAKVQLVKQKAMEMVVSDGFEGFSVNKLARACGISVATLYIYYKDKDDLIIQVALEEAERMKTITLDNFDPDMPFIDGLRLQWANRARYALENTTALMFFEQLRTSTYQEQVMKTIFDSFKTAMGRFIGNAVSRGEIDKMPLEAYWSVAFAPLYSLLRFHNEGRSIGGKKFKINEELMWKTFDLVVKALYIGKTKK